MTFLKSCIQQGEWHPPMATGGAKAAAVRYHDCIVSSNTEAGVLIACCGAHVVSPQVLDGAAQGQGPAAHCHQQGWYPKPKSKCDQSG
jgi:hypothetical protein